MEMSHSTPAQATPIKTAQATLPSQATSADDAALFNQLFNVTDKNSSGDVNMQELGDLLEYSRQQSGGTGGPIQGTVIQYIHKQADTSGDGRLSQDEFAQFLSSAMSEGTSTAPPTRQPMETDATTGTMIDPSKTAEKMQGANHQCGCDHSPAVSQEQAETLYTEFEDQMDSHTGACSSNQNKMVEFRNFLQNNKSMSIEDAEATVAALTPASTTPETTTTNSMNFLATNVIPITPSQPEKNHSAH